MIIACFCSKKIIFWPQIYWIYLTLLIVRTNLRTGKSTVSEKKNDLEGGIVMADDDTHEESTEFSYHEDIPVCTCGIAHMYVNAVCSFCSNSAQRPA